MNIFRCQSCDQVVFFENTQYVACGATLGFLPDRFLIALWNPREMTAGGRRVLVHSSTCTGYAGIIPVNRSATGYCQQAASRYSAKPVASIRPERYE